MTEQNAKFTAGGLSKFAMRKKRRLKHNGFGATIFGYIVKIGIKHDIPLI